MSGSSESLLELFAEVPDPSGRHGVRRPLLALLGLATTAMFAGITALRGSPNSAAITRQGAKVFRVEWLGQTVASLCWITSVFAYGITSAGDWLQLAAASAWLVANTAAVAVEADCMSAALDAKDHQSTAREFLKRGVGLLCQQTWCWGRNVLREQGNWLVEIGFHRTEAPPDRENCSSVYTLDLPFGRRAVLRGFGVFYGDDRLGGVFLPRYEFQPLYTSESTLECPPWSAADLPAMSAPDQSQRDACVSLTLSLIDWIRSYEAEIVERLGLDYRRSTLDSWDNGKRLVVPADQMADAWRSLAAAIGGDSQLLIPPS